MNKIEIRSKYRVGFLTALAFVILMLPLEAHAATKISTTNMSYTSYLRVKESRKISTKITGAVGKCSAL